MLGEFLVLRYVVLGEFSLGYACSSSAAMRTLWCCVHECISLRRMYFTTATTMAKKMACIQSRVETAEVKIMLSLVAAGNAAVNGKMIAASEGGRLRKSAYMAQQLFAAGTSHPPTSENSLGE